MPTKNDQPESKEKDTLLAALSYVSILWILAFLSKPKDEFTKFHMKQGLTLFLLEFILIIPIINFFLFWVFLVIAIIAFVQAFNGKKWEIPVVADLSKKLNI